MQLPVYFHRVQELHGVIDLLMCIELGLNARRVKGWALELESLKVQMQLSDAMSIENSQKALIVTVGCVQCKISRTLKTSTPKGVGFLDCICVCCVVRYTNY